MFRHLMCIWLMLCGLALTACSGDEPTADAGMVDVVFTIEVPQAGQTSRAGEAMNGSRAGESQEYVGSMENAIDPSRLHIVMYTNEGTNLGAIGRLSIWKDGEDAASSYVYHVVGSIPASKLHLQNGQFEGKVMVYANMDGVDEEADFTSDAISQLSFSYPDAKGYIPMWGVKKINAAFAPGKRTTLDGSISLLRAEAKIYVFLSQDMIDNHYELTEATLHGYNTMGYGLPQLANYRGLDNPSGLTTETSSHFYPSVSSAETQDMLDKAVYVPEYQNTGTGVNPSYITVTVRDKDKNDSQQYTVRFADYENGVSTGTPIDIVRNHYYRYELYRSSAGKIDVKLTVRKWAQVTHPDIVM